MSLLFNFLIDLLTVSTAQHVVHKRWDWIVPLY